MRLEPALASRTGPHLVKFGGVGVGTGAQVLKTSSEASSLPDHTAYPRAPAGRPGKRERR